MVSTMQKITKNTPRAHTRAKKKSTMALPRASTALGKDIVTIKASNQLKKAALDDAAPFKRVGKISPM